MKNHFCQKVPLLLRLLGLKQITQSSFRGSSDFGGGLKNDDVSNYIFENRGKVLMYFMDGPLGSSQIELFFESD